MRPPVPMIVGVIVPKDAIAPTAAPATVALIWVVVRLVGVLPGRNSSTRPVTCTDCPTVGLGIVELPRNTKTASDVEFGLAPVSGVGSCI